uniref:Maelstrom domain-containing protein n=1 Tax=Angiostrongylus cantonensis TaxID=6313 RepID=A0A0K0DPV3_ANGCA
MTMHRLLLYVHNEPQKRSAFEKRLEQHFHFVNQMKLNTEHCSFKTSIRFFSADPGIDIMPLWNVFITFFFSQNCPRLLQMLRSQLYRTVGISPTQAALRVIALGFSPMFDEYNGGHFHNYCFSEVHPMIKEQEKLDDIWNAIEEKLSNGPFYSDRVPSLM